MSGVSVRGMLSVPSAFFAFFTFFSFGSHLPVAGSPAPVSTEHETGPTVVIYRLARSSSWQSGPICTARSSKQTGRVRETAAAPSRSTHCRKIRAWTS